MKILAIDTSTQACSVAVTEGERLLAEHVINCERTHASRLIRMVERLFDETGVALEEIDGFAAAVGPGSFTGLRVGIATIKGLAFACNKPVYGFSSLQMLAMNLHRASHPVCTMFDARKKEVYAALYDSRGIPEALIEPCVISPLTFVEKIKGVTIFVGEGANVYRPQIEEKMGESALFAPQRLSVPRASCGALLALYAFASGEGKWASDLLPCYIRPSEAELAKRVKMKT